jgi:hypothetical protein
LALRLHGLHNPILDHPGWRQGDTASIAKNFATLQFNPLYPQTNYNGPPPNYVELELQIVPFLAAAAYKLVGIHEVIGRLISIGFSLGTIAVLYFFGRWLFVSEVAGMLTALLFAIMPGSFYYGRTFTPDTTMVFFLCAALYVIARMLVDEESWSGRRIAQAVTLLTLALLAKPVALVALVPIAALTYRRAVAGRTMRWGAVGLLFAIPLLVLYAYDRNVSAHAEWHWASGITTKHVGPSLVASFGQLSALHLKLRFFREVLAMLTVTMIGPAISALALLGFAVMPARTRSRTLLYSWLAGGLAYTYIVVTVERVDYYMYLLLPLAALSAAGMLVRLYEALACANAGANAGASAKYLLSALGLLLCAGVTYQNYTLVRPYYRYNKEVYRNAMALNARLPAGALIVMGHYDPSILYYIGRYGWEEDPYLWTPFDEQSAIRKGARYFIAIERNRFNHNVELCAWMQRFPVVNPRAQWPVYVTDPARVLPNAQRQWRAFRTAEKQGLARAWLDAHGLCLTEAAAETPWPTRSAYLQRPARPTPPTDDTQ